LDEEAVYEVFRYGVPAVKAMLPEPSGITAQDIGTTVNIWEYIVLPLGMIISNRQLKIVDPNH
jgi:hypothetical protein